MRPSTDERLNNLESLLSMLQHDFESQNEMILVYARQLRKIEKTIEYLQAEIDSLKFDGPSDQDEPEVPPHY